LASNLLVGLLEAKMTQETQLSLTKPRDAFVKRNGVADLLKTRPSHILVTMPNLVVLR